MRLRVLMVGAGDPPPTFIERAMRMLAAHDVDVFAMPTVRRHRFLRTRLVRYGVVEALPAEIVGLAQSCDVIHYQWPGHYAAFGSLAKRLGKPSLLSLRGRQVNVLPLLPGNERQQRDLRRSLRSVDAVHGVSRHILEEATRFGMAPGKGHVIRPAVDTSYFVPQVASGARGAGLLRIAMVGALMWRKGYEYALLAIRMLLDQGHVAKLQIIGDGEERERVEAAITDLGLANHVELLGKRDPAGVRDLLWRSDVLLLTSLSEGIANVVLEAMACGIPVVCTDAGGISEAVEDGREGFVVPLRDVRSIAARLASLARDPARRLELGQAARERAVQDFDVRAQARAFAELYRELRRS